MTGRAFTVRKVAAKCLPCPVCGVRVTTRQVFPATVATLAVVRVTVGVWRVTPETHQGCEATT